MDDFMPHRYIGDAGFVLDSLDTAKLAVHGDDSPTVFETRFGEAIGVERIEVQLHVQKLSQDRIDDLGWWWRLGESVFLLVFRQEAISPLAAVGPSCFSATLKPASVRQRLLHQRSS